MRQFKRTSGSAFSSLIEKEKNVVLLKCEIIPIFCDKGRKMEKFAPWKKGKLNVYDYSEQHFGGLIRVSSKICLTRRGCSYTAGQSREINYLNLGLVLINADRHRQLQIMSAGLDLYYGRFKAVTATTCIQMTFCLSV